MVKRYCSVKAFVSQVDLLLIILQWVRGVCERRGCSASFAPDDYCVMVDGRSPIGPVLGIHRLDGLSFSRIQETSG